MRSATSRAATPPGGTRPCALTIEGAGRIGGIGAWGPIAGHIAAAHAIEYVRSGDAVTAMLTAPSAATPVEFSESIFTEHPLPELPESITEQVLANGAQAYAQVLALRDEVAAEIAAMLTEFVEAKAEVATAIANAAADIAAATVAARAAAHETLNLEQEEAEELLRQERRSAESHNEARQAKAATEKAILEKERWQTKRQREAEHEAAADEAAKIQQDWSLTRKL